MAVDYLPGFETRLAEAGPLARYAAFVSDLVGRYRTNGALRSGHPELWSLLEVDQRRIQLDHALEWADGVALRHEIELAASV